MCSTCLGSKQLYVVAFRQLAELPRIHVMKPHDCLRDKPYLLANLGSGCSYAVQSSIVAAYLSPVFSEGRHLSAQPKNDLPMHEKVKRVGAEL